MKIIPVELDTPDFQQRTQIEGRDYIMTFVWNARACRWSLSISDKEASPIIEGLRLVVNSNLLELVTDQRKPPGVMFVLDQAAAGNSGEAFRDPTLESLGRRHVLAYFEASEL